MIKLLRMQSGEDVLGELYETETSYRIENPAVLMPMPDGRGNTIQMGMVPWQPFSKSKEFSIAKDWVVTVSNPSQEIEDNYRRVFGSGIAVPQPKVLMG
jgi:hypothetical protein|tara:strand:- start:151 stop:447 length:297 start_codon:yes stop_codon:yes gene_type:complete